MLGALPGHGKTFVMLSMVKALLTGRPLFGYDKFRVPRLSTRVLYLTPEVSRGPFVSRLKMFGLDKYVENRTLLYRTLSNPGIARITDPRILAAAKGADVFLDTAIRFMEGDENSSSEQKIFGQNLFQLLTAGARTVTGAHHSIKAFGSKTYITLEDVLRGSGDIAAILSTAWAIKQVDKSTNRIFVTNIKPRDFEPCLPFVLEGRPWIQKTGDFKMLVKPGEAGELSDHQKAPGRPSKVTTEQKSKVFRLHSKGISYAKIGKEVGLSKSTVERILGRSAQKTDSESSP